MFKKILAATASISLLAAPTLAGDAHSVEGFSFSYGNAQFTLSGDAEGIVAAGAAASRANSARAGELSGRPAASAPRRASSTASPAVRNAWAL